MTDENEIDGYVTKECPHCDGRGEVWAKYPIGEYTTAGPILEHGYINCPICLGAGEIDVPYKRRPLWKK